MNLVWFFAVATVVWAYACLLWNIAGLPIGGWAFWMVIPTLAGVAWRISWPFLRPRKMVHHVPLLYAIPRHERLFDVCVVFSFLVVLAQAVIFPMHYWDSIVLYGFKAKILFWEGTWRTPAFQDPSIYHMNANYPLLIPYLEATFYKLIGHTDDRWVRLLFVAYWLAFLGVLYDGLRLSMRPRVRRGILAVVATLPVFSGTFMGQASSGFVDIPFAFYWTGFWVAILRREASGRPEWWRLANLMALGGAFTKNEGLVLFILGWILYSQIRPDRERAAIGQAGVLLVLLVPWLWVRLQLTSNAVHGVHWPSAPLVVLAAGVRQVAWGWLREMATPFNWGIFWAIIAAALCWKVRGPKFPWTFRLLLAAVGLQCAVYGWAYLTASYSVALLVPITTQRLLLHLIGPLVLAAASRFQEPA